MGRQHVSDTSWIENGVLLEGLRRPPSKRLRQLLRPQPQIKPLFIRMPLNPAKPLRKRFGIAVLASRADLDAAADGIPGRISPFDWRVDRH